ncbi:MAG: YdcF family protein [Rickettsiales bacterium]|nr:YdcF family protein [Rickettsiales bacterium]
MIAACLVFMVAAFVHFLKTIPRVPVGDAVSTDAIVVLTGGSLRIQYGFELLEKGKAQQLFITGVGEEIGLDALMETHQASDRLRNDESRHKRIMLDHEANSTRSNAEQTAKWISDHGIRSIRMVTANYHLPRSMMEFRRAMPNLIVVPDPVFPENFQLDHWWQDSVSRELVLSEFMKYLVVLTVPELVT